MREARAEQREQRAHLDGRRPPSKRGEQCGLRRTSSSDGGLLIIIIVVVVVVVIGGGAAAFLVSKKGGRGAAKIEASPHN